MTAGKPTPQQKEQIVRFYRDGLLVEWIASRFGLNRGQVQRIARAAGLPPRGVQGQQPGKLPDSVVDEVARRFAAGQSLGQLSLRYKVHKATIFRYLRKRNINTSRGSARVGN
jgi:hypothetical protein